MQDFNFYSLPKCLQMRETVLALTRSPGSSKQLKIFSTTSVSRHSKKSIQVSIISYTVNSLKPQTMQLQTGTDERGKSKYKVYRNQNQE